jgi:hypothetical protein
MPALNAPPAQKLGLVSTHAAPDAALSRRHPAGRASCALGASGGSALKSRLVYEKKDSEITAFFALAAGVLTLLAACCPCADHDLLVTAATP